MQGDVPSFPAFKEWAPIVQALGTGRQICVLRKGGIAEGKGGFVAKHPRFWLFPTIFHPDPALLKAGWSNEAPLRSPADPIPLRFVAEVAHHRFLTSWAQVEALDTYHGWTLECLRERFRWALPNGIHLFILRVFSENTPLLLPPSPDWSGCKSWLDVPVAPEALTPVLADTDFARRFAELKLD